MHCKFLEHGLSIAYDHAVKPCCAWKYDKIYADQNQIADTNFTTWHKSIPIITAKNLLSTGSWPNSCTFCSDAEKQGRLDSIRGNGNQSYSLYKNDDITLEIRPGSICNFACQTCWPEASSRVANYHQQAGLIKIGNLNSQSIQNFDFLLPVKHRIKSVILLGGEPFYDKNCLKFLEWAKHNLTAEITMFTNGSQIDWQWIKEYSNTINLVFSLDAVGKPAEYIRYGTEWAIVKENYTKLKNFHNVSLRVNITTSVYNYSYISDIIEMLITDWPTVVSFGTPHQAMFRETSVPKLYREQLIKKLLKTTTKIRQANIENNQKNNAINALTSIVKNLNGSFDQGLYNQLKNFVATMDKVKKINIEDYCPETAVYFKP